MKIKVDSWAWVEKSKFTVTQLQALKYALTVQPRKVGNYPGDPAEPIELFAETETHLGVAREYLLSSRQARQAHEYEFETTHGDFVRWGGVLKFSGTLRVEQQRAIGVVSEKLRDGVTGGIVRASPGWGKTVHACALIAEMKVPTLVVVHKEFLVKQWEERIEKFLPGAKVGRVQQDECDFVGKHVVIAMIHSLVARKYQEELYNWPGLLIFDETHRVGAETWSRVPPQFPAKWRIGYSATPRRKDGAENVFLYHIGPILFNATEQRLKPKIRRVWTNFHLVKTERFNPNLASKSLLLRFLCSSEVRNRVIVEQMIQALRAKRKVMVLSERLQHLNLLADQVTKSWSSAYGPMPTIGRYVGGRKEEELAKDAEAQLILATSQFASEGLDIPALDTLVLAAPMGDVEQAVGRILRPHEGKKEPIVVDIRDDKVPLCKRLGEMRDRWYERLGC